MHERSNSGQRLRRQNPPNRPTPASRQRSASPTPAPSLSSLLQRHSVNVLPTASVMVKTGSKTFETAALIDPCTPVNCIDASRAAAFRLPTTSVGDDKVCNATIQSKCGTTKMEVVFKVEPKKCRRNHHTLLHMHERSNSGQRLRRQNQPNRPTPASRQRSASPIPDPSLSSLLQRHSVNVLPTASVMVKTGSKTFETAALIDPCTPVSCIDASRAAAFRLPTTSVGDDKVCNATIQSKCGTTKMEVVFKVEPKVGIRTPTRTLNDAVRTKFKGIQLADERFYLPATISVILGADVYPKVIQWGFLMVDKGLPVAQKTVFGWIISGASHQP
ncbi:uncharacterized protein LOC121467318 [Drosophila elegans]|uniref:uncharacterized protein LOC121467318 n=1 Tax=Drosophila elegans TaxID=30023 RepID=UPI001BC854F8|nr:uncharacterized protein LOC121467318 [Drosophila elegans]